MPLARILFTFAIVALLCGSAASAQTAVGEVNGTVVDNSGGALVGAAVKLTNQGTGIEDRAVTNSDGYFVFINVKPGTYVLEADASGFKSTKISPFNVGVSQTITQTIRLQLGTVTESISVTAEAVMVERSTSELGTVIEQKAVSDLPLNGRNFTQLLTLTPGVTPVSTAQNKSIGGVEGNIGIPNSAFSDASIQGQLNRSKLYFYDGIINTGVRGPYYIVIPNMDLVQEFKVVSHDAKAEFGGVTGGVTNIVSKPGTNDIHGSVFEYLRNNYFDARNAVTDSTRTGPAPFRQNQFGFAAGGPIIKNRTFISGGYDGWRYSKPTQDRSYVPTAAELNGDFSQTPNGQDIYNPYSTPRVQFRCDAPTGVPLPVNGQNQQDQTTGIPCRKLPAGLINTPMQQFLQRYAATPNLSDPSDPGNNFAQNRADTNNTNGFQIRVDHRFRDSDNGFFRYSEQRITVSNAVGEQSFTKGDAVGRNYGGGLVHTFSPTLILDVRAGHAGRPGFEPKLTSSLGVEPMKQAGFKDIDKFGGMLVRLVAPWNNPGSNADIGQRGDAVRKNPSWSVTPNLIWLKGNHNIKTGFWWIRSGRDQLNTFQQFFFANTQTADANNRNGMSLASALLALPNNFQGQLPILGGGSVRFKYASWAGYVQDEWKLKRTLTLTLGLRLDGLTQPQTTDGRLWNALDLFNQKWIIGASTMPPLCSAVGKAPCIPDSFSSDPHASNVILAGQRFFAPGPVRDNWGPRVGIAWQMTPTTVLRGGYGLYYDAVVARSQYAQNDLEMAIWPDATAFAGTVNSISTPPAQLQPISAIQGNFPTPLPTPTPWLPTNTFGDDPKIRDPYSHQWNLEVQRQITPNVMVAAAYVGSRNERLPYTGLANAALQASPNGTPGPTIDALKPMPWVSSQIRYTQSIGYSRYNSLQLKMQRRFSKGLHTLLSYTWSKSIDVSSGYFNVENGDGGSSTVQNYFDQDSARGVSGYDITHFLSWATVYELPFGKGKAWLSSGPLSWIVGNWQANYVLQARTGQPYTLQVSGDPANIGGTTGGFPPSSYARPNLIADPFTAGPVPSNPDARCAKTISQGGRAADAVYNTTTWFNACAFAVPSASFGTYGRDTLRGPHVFNMDYSMQKDIPLPREQMKFQLVFQAFNVFNVQNYSNPSSLTIGSATGGINTGVGKITTLATQPRQMQFGLKFVF